jgi:hypothetical protein
MQGSGALALAVMVLCAPVASNARAPRAKRSKLNRIVKASPDGAHKALITVHGVKLGRRLVRAERGKVKSLVWRRDSRALAYLQRTELGLLLVVLPRLDSHRPLTWRLPAHAQDLSRIFWISDTRIGVGNRELVPRVVVSWRSFVRTSSRNFY